MTRVGDYEAASRQVFERLAGERNVSPGLDAFITLLESTCGEWALVGGAPRSWATLPAEQPKDLDIVVSTGMDNLLAALHSYYRVSQHLRRLSFTRTSLGGFRMHGLEVAVDLWPASATINVASGRVPASNAFRAVAYSAPLSLDTLVVTSRGAVYERGFFTSFKRRTLSLRDGTIVGGERVARKACKLCLTYSLVPDLVLQALIGSHLGKHVLDGLLLDLFEGGARAGGSGVSSLPGRPT